MIQKMVLLKGGSYELEGGNFCFHFLRVNLQYLIFPESVSIFMLTC